MDSLTLSEENYLKAIFTLGTEESAVSTRAIAQQVEAKDSSVTDMLKRLAAKGLLEYERYHGVKLSSQGQTAALMIIRRHRLWEVFLVQKLGFRWDEVHLLAEQLEHIQSAALMDRMDDFLGRPVVDPHGDPIPDRYGRMPEQFLTLLPEAHIGKPVVIVRVKDDSSDFLQYLDATGLGIGVGLTVRERIAYDESLQLSLASGREVHISRKVAEQIMVAEVS